MSEDSVRRGSPGAGGWPTIRYFNKATGYDGADYKKKTDKSMCDELGDEGFMSAYVEEAGGTSLCSVVAPFNGCSDKEKAYIEKVLAKDASYATEETTRLESMRDGGGHMKPEAVTWLGQRLTILKKLAVSSSSEL